MHWDLSGQSFSRIENAVPEDKKVLFWDFENKLIRGCFTLCDYHYDGNALVHVDFLSKEVFEISLNGVFLSNPDFFQLSLGRGQKIKHGDTLELEMTECSIIISC